MCFKSVPDSDAVLVLALLAGGGVDCPLAEGDGDLPLPLDGPGVGDDDLSLLLSGGGLMLSSTAAVSLGLLKAKTAAPSLGFLMTSRASSTGTVSGIMNSFEIFCRSQWHFRGSEMIASLVDSSSSLKRVGTGPASISPSNRVASRGQALMQTMGRLSLKLEYLLVLVFGVYIYIYIYIYTYIYTYTHTHTHAFIYMYMYTYIHIKKDVQYVGCTVQYKSTIM